MADLRKRAAEYYDLNPQFPNDVAFYRNLCRPHISVLELGCGTGRILVSIADGCKHIHGIEISDAMLEICKHKLTEEPFNESKASAALGDITQFSLNRLFDLIIAPFRVIQCLEEEEQVDGLLSCIYGHLSTKGSCILNAFRPFTRPDEYETEWCRDGESFCWQVSYIKGRLTCHDRRQRFDAPKRVLYPELVYRYYEGEHMIDETVLPLVMRCFYPNEFERLIESRGFSICNKWGGYAGEEYGVGPELVIQFRLKA